MSKQKLGSKHDAPLRCDYNQETLSWTSGISKDFRMAHFFLLSVLVFSVFVQKVFSGIEE